MKKSLIALAVLAAAGTASAQSSVTLFGIVDAAVSHYSVSGGQSLTGLSSGNYNTSRLGFRGVEDLGGGNSASFWLEGQLFNDDGNAKGLNFQRRSTVSLAGRWGELRLGRDYVPTFWNDTVFDPFGTVGVGTNIILRGRSTASAASVGGVTVGVNDPTAVRASNSVGYFLPANIGGIYGQVMYAFDEQTTAGQKNGRYTGGRIGFANGPFDVAAAYGETKGANPTTAAAPGLKTANIAGSWNFGMAKLLAEYGQTKVDIGGTTNKVKGWMIGTLVPVGAGEIRASYGQTKLDATGEDPKAKQLALGYVHNLSKRTALYATYARIKNSNGAALTVSAGGQSVTGVANASSSGYDLGIRHSF